jgi:hypothetical protein
MLTINAIYSLYVCLFISFCDCKVASLSGHVHFHSRFKLVYVWLHLVLVIFMVALSTLASCKEEINGRLLCALYFLCICILMKLSIYMQGCMSPFDQFYKDVCQALIAYPSFDVLSA